MKVFLLEAPLLSEWVEMHKIRCRNTGTTCLLKSLSQIVWYPPYSSSSCGIQMLIFRVEEGQLKLLLFFFQLSKLEMLTTMKLS